MSVVKIFTSLRHSYSIRRIGEWFTFRVLSALFCEDGNRCKCLLGEGQSLKR